MLTKSERQTVKEVLHATREHFNEVCKEAVDGKLQDVVDGMDISISKLECLLKQRDKPVKIKVLKEPFTDIHKLAKAADKNDRLTVNVLVDFGDLVGNDRGIEGINDMVDELVIGEGISGTLADIYYRPIGIVKVKGDSCVSGTVVMEVNADVSDIISENLDAEADARLEGEDE